jgi:CRP/FNR family transcriptional regulator, anaerobic regulatory protein
MYAAHDVKCCKSVGAGESAVETCKRCPARARGFCSEFVADDLDELAEVRLPARSLAAGTDIYRQGDTAGGYYTVLDGWVALRTTMEDGTRHILDFAVQGAFLGIVFEPASELGHTAECLTEVRLCELPRARLHAFVADRTNALGRLLHITACHEARAYDHFVNLAGRNGRDRLAHLMVELFFRVHHRLPTHIGDSVAIPLTQAHIGEAIGLTAVHVSRMFAKLRKDGMASYGKGTLTVLNPERLLHAAGAVGHAGDYGRDGPFSSAPANH